MISTLIIFTNYWCDTCTQTAPLWAQISNKYTTDKMKFGEVDITKLPALAKNFKIDNSGFASKLPVLILY